MSFRDKLRHEAKAVALTTAYFAACFGMLLLFKSLILAEYQIEFHGLSKALVGALIVGKVVLLMEHVPLGAWGRRQRAWVDAVVRTALYGCGVVVVLLVEKAVEGRHEAGGIGRALVSVLEREDIRHVWATAIAVTVALLGFNMFSVLRRGIGHRELSQLFLSPIPQRPNTHHASAQSAQPPARDDS